MDRPWGRFDTLTLPFCNRPEQLYCSGLSEFLSIQIVEIPEPDPYLTLSIPATLDINYGDTQTPFDIQVKEGVFRNDMGNFEVLFPYSSFQCTSHDGTIPFTVTTNATGVPNGHHGDKGYFALFSDTHLPFICQGFINITSDDWVAAKPCNYTATLRVQVSWIA